MIRHTNLKPNPFIIVIVSYNNVFVKNTSIIKPVHLRGRADHRRVFSPSA